MDEGYYNELQEETYTPDIETVIGDICDINSTFKTGDKLILCVNIRSIFKNLYKLKNLLCHMVCKPLIVICTEAWLKDENFFINIEGFMHYTTETRLNRSDGIVVYLNEAIMHTVENVIIGKTESPTVTLILKNEKNLLISRFYRSHDYKLKQFSEQLLLYLDKTKNAQNHIVMGDFNVDIMDNSVESEDFLSNFFAYGYEPYFNGIYKKCCWEKRFMH